MKTKPQTSAWKNARISNYINSRRKTHCVLQGGFLFKPKSKKKPNLSKKEKSSVVFAVSIILLAVLLLYDHSLCYKAVPQWETTTCYDIRELIRTKTPTSFINAEGYCVWDIKGKHLNWELKKLYNSRCLLFCEDNATCWNKTII